MFTKNEEFFFFLFFSTEKYKDHIILLNEKRLIDFEIYFE